MIRYLWRYYINTNVPTERQSGGLYFTADYSGNKISNTDINKKRYEEEQHIYSDRKGDYFFFLKCICILRDKTRRYDFLKHMF